MVDADDAEVNILSYREFTDNYLARYLEKLAEIDAKLFIDMQKSSCAA